MIIVSPYHGGWTYYHTILFTKIRVSWPVQHFLSSLRYIIIDEAHVYTGTFGAHVANVIRRLVRLCSLYDNPGPQFICCSATIYNPTEHFASLVPLNCLGGEDKLAVITQDTSPRGRKVGR